MRLVNLATSASVVLPHDLLWVDELSWSPVVTSTTYTLPGALVVESSKKLSGRPITLQSQLDDMGWVKRSDILTLLNWAAIENQQFRLDLEYPTDARQFNVIFDQSSSPINATPVKGFPSHASDDWFRLTLKFIEVV